MAALFTIGHSTRQAEEFHDVLRAHAIQMLADIRAFPASRRLPHFSREALEAHLAGAGIGYVWMKDLGGYRKKIRDDSPHIALRGASFRNYADYTLTSGFRDAADKLVQIAQDCPTAYMCAERLWFHCHRMVLSDYLVAHGHQVFHIEGVGPALRHGLTRDARIIEGELVYRGDRLF
jgi:uncharacterized protein (DUF488 family)